MDKDLITILKDSFGIAINLSDFFEEEYRYTAIVTEYKPERIS